MTAPTGILFANPLAQPLSTTGQTQAGAYYLFFLTGTLTPANVYYDGLLTTPLSQTPGAAQPSCTANSAGQFNAIYLNPATAYRVQLFNSGASKLSDTDPYVPQPPITLTQASVGTAFYPATLGETAVGAVIVNAWYAPYCVDRYVTNATPGTTDCTAAWNYAVAAASVNGGVVTYGATVEYLVTASINCTVAGEPNQPGITIQGLGNGLDPTFGILAKHTQVAVFDCTGNDNITFRDVGIHTDATTYPQTGILTARNISGGSLIIRLFNVHIQGSFSVACYYNYASEDDVLVGCYFSNLATVVGTKCAVWTANNISALVSPNTTIATGSHSCIDHNIVGCQFINIAGTTTSDCIYLESIASATFLGGWASSAGAQAATSSAAYASANLLTVGGTITGTFAAGQQVYGIGVPAGQVIVSQAGGTTGGAGTYNLSSSSTWGSSGSPLAITAGDPGRALIYVDMTNGASYNCVIKGFVGEIATPLAQYGVLFSNNAQEPVGWTIDACRLANGGQSIACTNAGATMNGFKIGKTPLIGANSSAGLLWTGIVQSCTLDAGTSLTIGTSENNTLIGDSSTWTITARSHDHWVDSSTTNASFSPGIANTVNGWTVSSLTQAGKFEYTGHRVCFSIKLSTTGDIAWGSGATIPTLPGVATDTFSCTVVDATAGTVQGAGVITAGSSNSTITLTVAQTTSAHTFIISGEYFVA